MDSRQNGHRRNGREALTAEEQEALLATRGETCQGVRDRAILMLQLRAGLRIVEAHRSTMDDLDLENHHIWVWGKGHSGPDEYHPVHSSVEQALRDWLSIRQVMVEVREANEEAVFIGDWGGIKRLTRNRLGWITREHMREAGVYEPKVKTPQNLRHTFITDLANSGCPIHKVQKLARHKSILVTQT